MQTECCCISFDLFLDPRPSTFRNTVEIWNQINFYIQQNASTTQWLLANWPWPFSSLGYRKSVPAFLAMSFKSCATSLHKLWTPLLGRSCCANRPRGAIVCVEIGTDWTGIFRHKAQQTGTKSLNPHGLFSFFNFNHILLS